NTVKGMINGNTENWGFVIDNYNSNSTTFIVDSNFPANFFRIRTGVRAGSESSIPKVRPRLIIEVE
ncbi:MAG: hypothetical protein Q7S56_02135, partial [Nanoarchaeota archaeon]|nr:hypothetical protein [Nanoarchaeota archaeon]